jgi:hypothetical protein
MKKARINGLSLLIAGCAVFLAIGFAVESTAAAPTIDFNPIYFPGRCLLEHCDPYMESEVMHVYRAEETHPVSDADVVHQAATRYMYLPTSFLFTAPFAMLPWQAAHMIWLGLTVGIMMLASYLAWSAGADYAPVASGVLAGFIIANSETLIVLGNAAGFATGFCVVAVWCFLKERFVLAGVVCLAISLAIKPQAAGLVWLYFLLAGGVYRKRAWQTLLATLIIGLPGVLWVTETAPRWMQEWHSNIQVFTTNGGVLDPAIGGRNLAETMVNLQTVFSAIRNDPHFYNTASYLVCAPLLAVWVFFVLRSRPSISNAWLALAAITPVSLLPVYHHVYDTKLLLLTAPACAMLWLKGGAVGKSALGLTGAALVLTGDLTLGIPLRILQIAHPQPLSISAEMLRGLLATPVPLILLILSVFYLWVFALSSSRQASLPAAKGAAWEPDPFVDAET